MTAITTALSIFKLGDKIIIPNYVYGGTFRVLDKIFKNFKIKYSIEDTANINKLEKSLSPDVKAILIESPANSLLTITDIAKVSEELIRAHLPKELANRPIIVFDYYFLDGMNIMTDGKRGEDDVVVYKAKSEEDLMLWQYSQVCKHIGDWPEFDKRMGYPKTWRYYRAYAENNRWKYIEYTEYDYNAIEDSRLHGFEQYLALVKIGFPPDRWEKEVKIHIKLMNY